MAAEGAIRSSSKRYVDFSGTWRRIKRWVRSPVIAHRESVRPGCFASGEQIRRKLFQRRRIYPINWLLITYSHMSAEDEETYSHHDADSPGACFAANTGDDASDLKIAREGRSDGAQLNLYFPGELSCSLLADHRLRTR